MKMRAEVLVAVDWAIRCFGFAHVKDKQVRALRLVEEAMELAQAAGVPRERMAKMADYVYARPRGDIIQELGGVLMTAYLMCAATCNEDPDSIFLRELRRVLNKTPEEFAQRNKEKLSVFPETRDPYAQAYFEDAQKSNEQTKIEGT